MFEDKRSISKQTHFKQDFSTQSDLGTLALLLVSCLEDQKSLCDAFTFVVYICR